ncbi:hypothetical protein V1511DRAFT_509648 [Dipodascopsis uninucleata]
MSYSDVRIYIRPIGRDVDKLDIEDLFKGYGKLVEIKLMSGFGFVEFENPRDAQDVVEEFNNKNFRGERLLVEFAKDRRRRDDRDRDRDPYSRGRDRDRDRDRESFRGDRRLRRSGFRLLVSGLPSDCSWQDLKDFARRANIDILFADVSRDRDGSGVIEVEREDDLEVAMEKLDGDEIKGSRVTLTKDISDERDRDRSRSPYRGSPPPRRSYHDDGYRRRRDYSRSPPPRRGGRRDDYRSNRRRDRNRHDNREREPRRDSRDGRDDRDDRVNRDVDDREERALDDEDRRESRGAPMDEDYSEHNSDREVRNGDKDENHNPVDSGSEN